MIEAGPSRPQAEEILVMKDEIAERWNRLPPEHQASLALTLSANVMDGEYGPWFLTAIALLHPEIHVPLPLPDEHLKQVGLSDEELLQLGEADRQNIRQRIIDHWLQDVYWQDLEYQATKLLEEKSAGSNP